MIFCDTGRVPGVATLPQCCAGLPYICRFTGIRTHMTHHHGERQWHESKGVFICDRQSWPHKL